MSDSLDEEEIQKRLVPELKEKDRLAYLIRAIDADCASLPVGYLKILPSNEIRINRNFKSKKLEDSLSLKNWL